jgi:hypothetical protein
MYKCFVCLQTYIACVASRYLKSRSSVTHGMRVGNGGGGREPRVAVRKASAGGVCWQERGVHTHVGNESARATVASDESVSDWTSGHPAVP